MQINQGNPCLANRQIQILFNLGIILPHLFPVFSQTGFNNKYDLSLPATTFRNLVLDGDTLWNRHFTAWPDSPDGTRNFLGGVVVLPSGSVVAAGYTERFAPVSVNYQGWVIKIDKDGCVDTLCITSSAPVPVEEKVEVVVYPNPASDEVTFDASGRQGEVSIQVYDHSGVRVWGCNKIRDMVKWRPTSIAQGFYFYRIADRNNLPIKAGTIVLTR
ncbi:MAG: T9SS type A sorting domain-containing protein [Saprospiraceae bacterium]|nr:T9SS type A sorting domain-containing protein [Saprospiraceae bacterium]